jgi:hypothetical protein
MFSITINTLSDAGNLFPNAATIIKAFYDLVAKDLAARIICASTGNIEIDVTIDPNGQFSYAYAGANWIDVGDFFHPQTLMASLIPMQEILTGTDVNGKTHDATMTFTPNMMRIISDAFANAVATSNPDAALMASGPYQTFLHEMMHVLGFGFGNDDPYTGAGRRADGSSAFVYDNWTFVIDGKPYFTGPTATAIYGAKIPLVQLGWPGVSMNHFDGGPQEDGKFITVLENDLMQPNLDGDNPRQISNLDLAVLADLGYAVRSTLISIDGHTFVPGQGPTSIAGTSASNDRVFYATPQSSFTIERAGATTTVTTKASTTNVATLSGIESVAFSDGTVALDYNDVVQSLYIAYFGRPADKGGLANFQNALRAMGAPKNLAGLEAAYGSSAGLKELVDSFASSGESKALYGTGSTTAFVTQVYMNVLGRAPDAGGLAYWAGEIDQGHLGRPKAALSIMAGAQGNTTTQGLLDGKLVLNRISAGSNFTLAIDTAAELKAYSGDAAAATARAMLATVQSTTDTHVFQATVTATLEGLVTKAATALAPAAPIIADGNDIDIILIGPSQWQPHYPFS